ncbi:MAG: DUF5711 family protein [Lachnospiraceae bacterium]|nr:DUF5711 family protein [Lachnospiraceae bacterium]
MQTKFSVFTNTAQNMVQAQRKNRFFLRYRIFMGGLAVLMLLLAMFAYQHRYYRGYHKLQTVTEEASALPSMVPYRQGFIRYTTNTVTYYKYNGTKVWDSTCSAKNPLVRVAGNYVVIADKEDVKVSLYDKNGEKKSFVSGHPVMDVELSNQGIFALITRASKTNYIEMYNENSEKLVGVKTTIDENGFPLDMTLSPNGKTLCVSYFIVDGLTTKNSLTFYDFSEKGEETKHLLGGFDLNNTIVPTVAFIGESTVVAFGDDRIQVYQVGKKIKETKEIILGSNLKSIAYDDEHFAVVRERGAEEKDGNYTLEVFSKNGNRVGLCGVDEEYADMTLVGDTVTLTGSYRSAIYSIRGSKIFDYKFSNKLAQIIPGNKGREYFVGFNDRVDQIKLK